jgi:hypothetical protein
VLDCAAATGGRSLGWIAPQAPAPLRYVGVQPGGRSWAARFMRLRRHPHFSRVFCTHRISIACPDRSRPTLRHDPLDDLAGTPPWPPDFGCQPPGYGVGL